MKKIFTLLTLALITAFGAGAQYEKVGDCKVLYPQGSEQFKNGGLMIEAISPNGKYYSGSCWGQACFTGVVETMSYKIYTEEEGSSYLDYGADLPSINNLGQAVGWDDNNSILVNATTQAFEPIKLADIPSGILGGQPYAISGDGTIIVGRGEVPQALASGVPCYWKDGKAYQLPYPNDQEAGMLVKGAVAFDISDDGRVIMGGLRDRYDLYPLLLWIRQDDGTYQLDPVCLRFFSDVNYAPDPTKEFREFGGQQKMAMSPDGKTVALIVRKNPHYGGIVSNPGEVADNTYYITYYDIKSGTLSDLVPFPFYDGGIYINFDGLSNGKTIAGFYVSEYVHTSWIMYEGGAPMHLQDAFPEVGDFADWETEENALSGISANGRYISGTAFLEITGVEGIPRGAWAYQGFIIDTGMEYNGVEGVAAAADEDAPEEYYSLDGLRLDRPVKGINIVRKGNTTKKVIL